MNRLDYRNYAISLSKTWNFLLLFGTQFSCFALFFFARNKYFSLVIVIKLCVRHGKNIFLLNKCTFFTVEHSKGVSKRSKLNASQMN